MSLKQLPAIKVNADARAVDWDVREDALAKWNPAVRAAEDDMPSISIYEQIGYDPWDGTGVTVKRIDAALRNIGKQDVVVNINSPGGSFFEGLAIYNRLRQHEAKVNVRVVGLAASAASAIAMAGDSIEIGRAAFLMIHNVWGLVIGNRHDLGQVAQEFEAFDGSLAGLYAAQSGMDEADIATMMDAETWLNGQEAVDKGFADGLLAADQVKEDGQASQAAAHMLARKQVEKALQKDGKSRAEQRQLIAALMEFDGKPGAAVNEGGAKPGAGTDGRGKPGAAEQEWVDALREMSAALKA